jgi:predicted 3-demethylubiquinone-9 3-methyltransferase (glyoxalase superfamily)
MTSAVPFLMFQGGKGEEAIDFYVATVPDSRVVEIERFAAGEQGPEGTIKRARIVIAGQTVLVHDSFIRHQFDFTPSFSFFVDCDDEAAFDRLVAALSDGGYVLMPPDNYGWSRKFGWVSDRFGVSWQVDLA